MGGRPQVRSPVSRPLLALAMLVSVVLLAAGPQARSEAPARPNVLVVMTDDQTVEAMRVMPQVRSLIGDQGTTFANSFVNFSFCCPSRSTFVTGQYAENHGIEHDRGFDLLESADTLPVWLQVAGYHTGFIGKYVNGYGFQDPTQIPPGWSEWYGALPDDQAVYDYDLSENGAVVHYGTAPADFKGDVITAHALDFLSGNAGSADPFFLTVAYTAPHTDGAEPPCADAAKPAPRDLGEFAHEPLPQPPSFNEADVSDKPQKIAGKPALGGSSVSAITSRYRCALESLQYVDDGVASLLGELADAGELDSTLIIFTSDNGEFNGEHRIAAGKVWPYEEGIRVPLMMRGPGVPAGAMEDSFATNADLAPTILDAANAQPTRVEDGQSLFRLISGARPDRDLLLESHLATDRGQTPFDGLRTRRYLYVEYATGERELYDLDNDPNELQSLDADPSYLRVRNWLARRLEELRTCRGTLCRRSAGQPPQPLDAPRTTAPPGAAGAGSSRARSAEPHATAGGKTIFTGGPSFERPDAVAVSPANGNVYVTDAGRNRIEEITPGGEEVGRWGERGSGEGQLIAPHAVAVAPGGDVYVADAGNDRVQQFTAAGGFVREWGDRGSADGQFDSPEGIAVAPGGDVYVSDSGNDRIERFGADGTFIGIAGDASPSGGGLDSPGSIAIAAGGDVYVTDRGNDRVVQYGSGGTVVRAWGSFGSATGKFSYPRGIALAPNGDVYVADTVNSRVQQFAADGTFVRSWGSRGLASGRFLGPRGIAVAANGDVYVADSLNARVERFAPGGGFEEAWGASAVAGRLGSPRAIGVAPSGDVYVADAVNNRIERFREDGTFVRAWGTMGTATGQFEYPAGVAVDASGDVYVADTQNQRVQEFTANGSFVRRWGSSGSQDGEFAAPTGIDVAPGGDVYVTDSGNDRIQAFTPQGSFIRAWGSEGRGAGEFQNPQAVAVAPGGAVYVTDNLNFRVQRFTSTGAFVKEWGGPGEGPRQFEGPVGITVAPNGDVYVADPNNDRLSRFAPGGALLGSATGPLIEAPRAVAATATPGEVLAGSGSASIVRIR